MSMQKDIIIASQSPRRIQILRALGISFRTVPSGDEKLLPAVADPVETARSTALNKAHITVQHGKGIVIAADTVVADGGYLLGKPETEEDIYSYLRRLQAKDHIVINILRLLNYIL